MKTYLTLQNVHQEELPEPFRQDDVRYPESLVRAFLEEHTREGALVFDPFAGFGTTLHVAEGMGRLGFGLELDEAKLRYARARMVHPERLLLGDARQLSSYPQRDFDFAMTSPPFMNMDDIEDPLTDYSIIGKGYRAYLHHLRGIFAQLGGLMKPAAKVVVDAANMKRYGRLTTLAWDLAGEVSQVLHFEGEVVICWDSYDYGYDHSYCLVFSVL